MTLCVNALHKIRRVAASRSTNSCRRILSSVAFVCSPVFTSTCSVSQNPLPSLRTHTALDVGASHAMSTVPPPPGFDPVACAGIHNQIIAHIAPVARDRHDNTVIRNFFEAYTDQAAAIRARLSAPLVQFLENVDNLVTDGNEGGQRINFMPHLRQPHPDDLWGLNGGLPGSAKDVNKWVVLYPGGHSEVSYCIRCAC